MLRNISSVIAPQILDCLNVGPVKQRKLWPAMDTKIKVIEPYSQETIREAAEAVRNITTKLAKVAVANHFCEQFMFCPGFNRNDFMVLCGLTDK